MGWSGCGYVRMCVYVCKVWVGGGLQVFVMDYRLKILHKPIKSAMAKNMAATGEVRVTE